MKRLMACLILALGFAQAQAQAQAPPPPNFWRRTGPNTIAPRRNDSVSIGPTLPGATAGGTVGAWNKYTVAYTNAAFQTAATAVSIVLGELPANGAVEAVRLKHSVGFAGTGVTSFTCSLGDGTNHTAYADAFNVFQAVSNTAQYWDGGAYSSTAAAHNLTLRCTANANVGDGAATVLTAGSVTIWVKAAVLQ